LLEELAAADASFAIAAAAPIGVLSAISGQGSAAQKEHLLPLFSGDKYQCASVAIMEPEFAFDVSSIRTAAIKTRDGYRLSGIKGLVPLADRSSHFLVVARCDGAVDAFIVDRNSQGVSVGERKPGLGLRALETATVLFSDVELSFSDRLGGSSGCDVQRVIDSARTALAAILTGTSRAVMEFVIPYCKGRILHGSPLAQRQSPSALLICGLKPTQCGG
jgi:alkylation response protein AidB-like acyl-CoA dehydrogenase